ncbi:MAG: methionyl-tRNA formyltransferase [Patescibacteria group bacterium]
MKYIFFGTPEFSTIILEKLINAGFIPEAVVCNPDKPVGRKKIITPPAIKLLAQKYNILVLQPEKLEIGNWKLEINKLGGADFAIVAAYSKIIPKTILDSLPAKFIGVHPSLLPKYRGPSPIQTAILNGDEETGVSLYLMDEKVDHGAILANRKSQIANRDTYESLHNKLAELGADLLIDFLRKIKQINNQQLAISNLAVPQNESQTTYTKKFKTQNAFIEPQDLEKAQNGSASLTTSGSAGSSQVAAEIDRKIRALNPEPGVWTIKNNKRIKLLEAKITSEKLELLTIQPEGKKPTKWVK